MFHDKIGGINSLASLVFTFRDNRDFKFAPEEFNIDWHISVFSMSSRQLSEPCVCAVQWDTDKDILGVGARVKVVWPANRNDGKIGTVQYLRHNSSVCKETYCTPIRQ